MKAILNDYEVKDIVKMLREWTGETQEGFAKRVNRSYASIRKIESGERNIYLHTLLEWADIFGIKITMEKKG